MFRTACVAILALAWCAGATLRSQSADNVPVLHRPLDQLLDLNVRDGLVYYRALRSERGQLDRYVGSLNVTPAAYGAWSRDEQVAFWLNAYNAIVLRTIINAYPIQGKGASGRSPAPSSRPSIASPAAR